MTTVCKKWREGFSPSSGRMMPVTAISDASFPIYLRGFSAIDSYLGRNSSDAVYVSCSADLADLARLFENLRYPGAEFADAAACTGGRTWYFQCDDSQDIPGRLPGRRGTFAFLEFYQDYKTRRFYDPNGIYPYLRSMRDGNKHHAT